VRMARIAPGFSSARVLPAHLESNFISPDYRGAQPGDCLRLPPGLADVQHAYRAEQGEYSGVQILAAISVSRADVAIVTLAPELPGAIDLTRRLVDGGVTVAAGHSATSTETLRAAVGVGLSHITHLWSGQSIVSRTGPWRVPGFLEASLASTGLTAEVIADGKHLPPELLTIARRCLGDRLCLVSDGISGTGLPEGTRFTEGGLAVEIRDGVCMLRDGTSFAGSTTPLNGMLAHVVNELHWSVPDAVRMASTVPASVAGMADRKGRIRRGYDADIAVFADDFTCWAALVGGRWVHGPQQQAIGNNRNGR